MRRQIVLLLLCGVVVGQLSFAQTKGAAGTRLTVPLSKEADGKAGKPQVTFIELGSVNCIPCKAMQPVMKAIEDKYGNQIKVVFYDVWKQEQAHVAQQYKVRLIPTQVFLDARGNELLRHEGFFPEKEIDTFLQSKGLKANSSGKR